MTIEVTVLGSSGSHTGPGSVCSGYLLGSDGTRVMVEAGNGSSANLQTHLDIHELDAIVVSHQHVDHCIDLIGMYYALRFGAAGPNQVPLYAHRSVIDMLTSILSGDSALEFREAFDIHEIDAGQTVEIGAFSFELFPSVHSVPTLSMRITADDTVVAFSADSAGGPDLVDCARGADLFLCEATWHGDQSEWPEGIHLTARSAGEHASRAGVDRLALTHVVGGADRDRSVEEARETFTSGDLTVARDNDQWSVG
ncbi:MAG: MBL fold metallo-hydrolase [Nitriliruptorales bacterium]|nr:MBL fold metallo-hydrolase [Nitriliruptorales bacterium]